MKNFKKVIAFLMVAAMTLGMGTVAFAEGTSNDYFEAKAEKVDDTTVKIQLIATKEIQLNAAQIVIALDDEYLDVAVDKIQADSRNKYKDKDTGYSFGKAQSGYLYNYVEKSEELSGSTYDNCFVIIGAAVADAGKFPYDVLNPVDGTVIASSGNVLAEVYVPIKDGAEIPADTKIATVYFPGGITDDAHGTPVDGKNKLMLDSFDVLMSEAKQDDSSNSSSSSSSNSASSSSSSSSKVAASDNTTAAAGATTAAQKVTNKNDAIKALDTLDKAVAAAKKLSKSAFASDADYQAFQNALAAAEKVLNDKNATAEQKAAALKALTDILAKADETALVNAVNAILPAAAATTATTKKGKGGKTGDAAPIAALMIVAIAAFGTAVVVYRKKVNA